MTAQPAAPAVPDAHLYVPKLDTTHRCDRCGAQAYFQVTLESNTLILTFCRHHWHAVRHVLSTQVSHVIDDSSQLFDGVAPDKYVTPGKEQALPKRQQEPYKKWP